MRQDGDQNRVFDLAVCGAGINGLAIARDAASRGLDVVVVDRSDIGSGTTSVSSRLIHGGLKYLERLDMRLVRESIAERDVLFRTAPHLVHDYPMLIPFYERNTRSRFLLRFGLVLFDLMSFRRSKGRSRGLSRSGVLRRWSQLSPQGLRGGALYHDAQVPWAERLCVELLLDARDLGATVLPYTMVRRLEMDGARVAGLRVVETTSGAERTIRARVTVNASGPWIDRVLEGSISSRRLNGGTKGSHVVVDPFPGAPDTCVFYEAASDHRPIFIFPWNGRYMLGSTDLTYEGDLDEVVASDAEIEYLLNETNRLVPSANLAPDDVLFTFSGVRPLPYTANVTDNADISRGHTVLDHAPEYQGLLTVIGGKLTTHRALAEDVTDDAMRMLTLPRRECVTATRALPGADTDDWRQFQADFHAASPLPAEQSSRLLNLYGVRAERVVDLARSEPRLAAVVDVESGALAAEIVLAFGEECATTLADAMLRRTLIGLGGDMGVDAAARSAQVGVEFLGWDETRRRWELENYQRELRLHRPRALRRAAAQSQVDGDRS